MKTVYFITLTLLILTPAVMLFGQYTPGSVSGGGTISGSVMYDGKAPVMKALKIEKDAKVCAVHPKYKEDLVVGSKGGLKNVVVYIDGIKSGKAWAEEFTLDQNGCSFVPHVTIVAVGQRLRILNSDGILHNILISNSEFTDHHICASSRNFMKRKLPTLGSNGFAENVVAAQREHVLAKACLCRDLAVSATQKLNVKRDGRTLICCGPGITSFSKKTTLEEMVDHIYGRISLLTDPDRPHMFIKELKLYVEYIRKEVEQYKLELSNRTPKYFREFKQNIKEGIQYYTTLIEDFIDEQREQFLTELDTLSRELDTILTDKLLELQPVEVS